MKTSKFLIATLLAGLVLAVVFTLHAQQTAAVQMAQPETEISGGKTLVLEVRLNEPLPPETTVIARVRPEATSQLLVLSAGAPDDSNRTKVTLRTTLPNTIVPGKWVLQDVFVALPGTNIWQALEHNQVTFNVKGKPFPIPSKAEITVTR